MSPADTKQRTPGERQKNHIRRLSGEIVREDLKTVERDEFIKNNGYKTMDYHKMIALTPVASESIVQRIFLIRRNKVMLDAFGAAGLLNV